ncbi:hypothetical protein KZ813_10620 [Sphingomonas sp. RHCKR7]|nr:hypothetical protein [Sphingomonas folli]
MLVAGCVPQVTPPPPAPAPTPAPVPAPAPTPPPAPPAADWQDWPRTPGTWRYARAPGGSTASFGAGAAVVTARCDRDARTVTLTRVGGVPAPFTIRTSATARTLPAAAVAGGAAATLAASDRLLDAMVFSRGRFTLEQPGAAPLVLPPWAELARVIEDCRG